MILSRSHIKIPASFALVLLLFQNANAQAIDNDFLRSTGKIYSVIAAIVIIFIIIIIYLWRLDNKLTKLENHIKDEH
jgi:CcmD family protein